MKVSFLIATHSAQSKLPNLVQKFLFQSTEKTPIEIVISQDDGFDYSTILPQDNRIIYSGKGLNSGPSASRNRALSASNGTHICLMDSDDDICDNYIGSIFDSLKTNNAVAIKTQYIESGKVIRELNNKIINFKDLYSFYGSVHTVAPKEWTTEYVNTVAEDVLATVNVIDRNGGYLSVIDAHYKLVLHSDSYCAKEGAKFSNMYKDAIRDAHSIVKSIKNPNLINRVKELYETRLAMSIAFDEEISNNPKANYHDFVSETIRLNKKPSWAF
jgi:glycosyltransferase involved in cell wall biosynthesis